MRLAFRLLDGGELTDAQKSAARELAEKLGFEKAAFSPRQLDGIYRDPSPLAAKLPGLPGVKIWSETPMKRVYPDMTIPEKSADGVTLHSAANERESVQLVFKPEQDALLEKVAFSDLTAPDGKKIPADHCYTLSG